MRPISAAPELIQMNQAIGSHISPTGSERSRLPSVNVNLNRPDKSRSWRNWSGKYQLHETPLAQYPRASGRHPFRPFRYSTQWSVNDNQS